MFSCDERILLMIDELPKRERGRHTPPLYYRGPLFSGARAQEALGSCPWKKATYIGRWRTAIMYQMTALPHDAPEFYHEDHSTVNGQNLR